MPAGLLPDERDGVTIGYFVYLDDKPIGYVRRSPLNPSVWNAEDIRGTVLAQRGSRSRAAAYLKLHPANERTAP